jgi:hypothetical protein
LNPRKLFQDWPKIESDQIENVVNNLVSKQ